MKSIILVVGIFTTMMCNAQSASIESIAEGLLFRGYENILTPIVADNKDKEVKLAGDNVTIRPDSNSDGYVVKTGNDGSTAILHVLLVDGNDVDTVKSEMFRFYNLPDPNVYWGDVPNDGRADIKAKEFSIRYPDGVPFPNEHSVVSWETSYNGKSVSGKGNNLSSAEEFLKTIPSGTALVFKITVIGTDEVTRVRDVSWTVGSWEE